MPRGGYRRPQSPSPVSGPGSLSRRTDGSVNNPAPPLSDAPSENYGERTQRIQALRAMNAPPGGTVDAGSGAPTPGAASGAGGAASTPPSAAGAGPPEPGSPGGGVPGSPTDLSESLFAPSDPSRTTPAGGPSHRLQSRQARQAKRQIWENHYALLEEIFRADPNNDVLELLQMQLHRGMRFADEYPRMAEEGYENHFGATSMEDIDPRFRLDLGDPSITRAEDYNTLDESEITPPLSEQEAERLHLGHDQANIDYLPGNPFAYVPASRIREMTGRTGEPHAAQPTESAESTHLPESDDLPAEEDV